MSAIPDPAFALTPTGNLRRRAFVSRLFEGGSTGAALLAVAVLGIVVYTVVHRGGSQISWSFLTTNPRITASGSTSGGIAYLIVGSAVLVALASVIAIPIGVLSAVYVTEFAGPRASQAVALALDLLNGLPSIIIGVFVYSLILVGSGQTGSGFAGSVGLSIIMVPFVARSSQEVLRRVPKNLREGADALGISRWRTVVGVILPAARTGIVTGSLLGVARAAGETAPLILVCSIYPVKTLFDPFGQALPNIPVGIFQLAELPDPNALAQAWGAALVLLAFILALNVGARAVAARSSGSAVR